MLKKSIIVAGAMLFAASAFAQSGTKNSVPSKTPGHMMQNDNKPNTRGASEYAPGQRMQDANKAGTNTGNGASNFAPPNQTTTGSAKSKTK